MTNYEAAIKAAIKAESLKPYVEKGEISKEIYSEEWLLEYATCGCSMHHKCRKSQETNICPEHGVKIEVIGVCLEMFLIVAFLVSVALIITARFLVEKYYMM